MVTKRFNVVWFIAGKRTDHSVLGAINFKSNEIEPQLHKVAYYFPSASLARVYFRINESKRFIFNATQPKQLLSK